jgi:pyruvate/2-oxoglutarate dehydrogenase complex dihydrolipoamide acyltransferase (E2) component
MSIVEVLLPQAGMGMQDGEVVEWLKNIGDVVKKDEVILEVESAKVTIDVVAPVAGELIDIVAEQGSVIAVRDVIARIKEH